MWNAKKTCWLLFQREKTLGGRKGRLGSDNGRRVGITAVFLVPGNLARRPRLGRRLRQQGLRALWPAIFFLSPAQKPTHTVLRQWERWAAARAVWDCYGYGMTPTRQCHELRPIVR